MRAAISWRVRGSINPCAAYGLTSSYIGPASTRMARRTVVWDAVETALENLREAAATVGRLCTPNVYINIATGARPNGCRLPCRTSVAREDLGFSGLVEAENLVVLGPRSFHSR